MQKTGELITAVHAKREEIRELDVRRKALVAERMTLEASIIEKLDEDGVSSAKGLKASVSISENIIPVVKDWDLFYGYILDTKQPYLLERRPSVSSYRELLESGVEVPGLQPFTKRTLNIRSAI
jgi:hypothetical protein